MKGYQMIGCLFLAGFLLTSVGSSFAGSVGFAGGTLPQAPSWRHSKRTCPLRPAMKADGSDRNVIEEYREILKNLDETPPERRHSRAGTPNFLKSIAQKASKLKTCETDYDCNSGGRNYPLRCVNFVVANFCVDSDDWTGGTPIRELAPELIPVRVEDGYVVHPGQPGWPGSR
eukprot:CAMPEP_0202812388 /NCGR_PEP_ID=MMETSP1389-20130828/4049_1 /ASSEMBLY_ACC=CAM_ASM_000865 /TAXON_ID=302021 /ORGANISM="Rhodomonas sp., Strain CCMP768" /LENGTH=172 /DNA_ID=CAMNT_0049483771 /DNA_START=18 /DNA_END=536 /DNA_ORIENTATION=+